MSESEICSSYLHLEFVTNPDSFKVFEEMLDLI